MTHQHRDTLASIVGHAPLLSYISIADGESRGREKFEVIEVSLARRFWWGHADTPSACSSLVDCRLARLTSRDG